MQNTLLICRAPVSLYHLITSYPFHTSSKIPQLMTKISPTREVIAPPKTLRNDLSYTTNEYVVARYYPTDGQTLTSKWDTSATPITSIAADVLVV